MILPHRLNAPPAPLNALPPRPVQSTVVVATLPLLQFHNSIWHTGENCNGNFDDINACYSCIDSSASECTAKSTCFSNQNFCQTITTTVHVH
eukprot:m.78316 g.78316  ORF g.78316 m.78316 type:complete len:92 (+) comp36099_c0_seq1:94-369(+)